MNAKKRRTKQRRRARRLSEEAWDAVEDGNLDLAEKLIRRATGTQPNNPLLWHDRGVIIRMAGRDAEAEDSFRAALSLAPDFADAYAELATICVRCRRVAEAVSLQQQAVQHAPNDADHRMRLESYRSLMPHVEPQGPASNADDEGAGFESDRLSPDAAVAVELAGRLSTLDWRTLDDELTRSGCVLIPELIDAATCAAIRDWFGIGALFAKAVVMDQPNFGRGEYRYFQAPVPEFVDWLRCAVYAHVAPIANVWQKLLGLHERFPVEWSEFRDACHRAGQETPTPILLKYEEGGFNALHRDLRGDVYFPIQLAVVLSQHCASRVAQGAAFEGGEFLFVDTPDHKKSRRQKIVAGLGDAVLFCTRDRLVPVGGAYGLQSVKHGVSCIESGTRLVLGLPFHEYR